MAWVLLEGCVGAGSVGSIPALPLAEDQVIASYANGNDFDNTCTPITIGGDLSNITFEQDILDAIEQAGLVSGSTQETTTTSLFPEISIDDYWDLSGAILVLFIIAYGIRVVRKTIDPRS